MDNNQQNGGALPAFLLGAIVGAAAALLLAPASGAKTRRSLAGGLKKWLEEGENFLNDARETLCEQAKKISASKETSEE